MGYNLKKKNRERSLNHLLFMDDIKLFVKSEEQTDSLVQTVFHRSKDIGMEFEISKCAVYTINRDAPVASQQLNLLIGEKISNPEKKDYK